MLGFGDHSVGARDSQSMPFPGYSLCFTQGPCSRQRTLIPVSAMLQAKAAPEAPAPMIRTPTGSSDIERDPTPGGDCEREVAAPGVALLYLILVNYITDRHRGCA
jgi:hypothetical protein